MLQHYRVDATIERKRFFELKPFNDMTKPNHCTNENANMIVSITFKSSNEV